MRGVAPLPGAERRLLTLLVRGPGAESVLGDVEEAYRVDVDELGSAAARARLRRQVIATCVAWWLPGAVVRRRMAGRGRVSGRSWNRMGKGGGMRSGWQDVRFAVRALARRPGFAIGVAATLGLGIGATTTIFSVVDAVLLRPLPYEESSSLAAVGATFPTREWADESSGLQHLAGISMLNFLDYRERARSFEHLAGIETTNVLLPDGGDGPELVAAASVSTELFEVLDVTPALGRTFLPGEHTSAAAGAMMISYGAWMRRFGGDPGVVGRPLEKVGTPLTIVGVLPEDFAAPEAFFSSTFDFWMPLQPDHPRYAERGSRSLYVLGRLRAGTDVEAAREEARSIAARLASEHPEGNVYPDGSWLGIGVNSLHAQTVGTSGAALGVFLGAATLLLLLAAMNAATLLIGRALDRTDELGIRTALGAGRARVVRLMLGEALILAAFGCLIGVAIAYAGVATFLRFAPSSIPRITEVTVDTRVLLVAAGISVAAGLMAGLLPAARSSRRALGSVAGSVRGASARSSSVRAALVGGQVTLAVVLLSGAALLLSSFARIRSVEPGFEPEGLVTLNVSVKRPGAPPGEVAWQAWDRVLDELRAVPGVSAVAGTTNPPFQSPFWAPRLLLPGDPPELRREGIAGYAITPEYLETVGTSVLAGRGIGRLDGPDAERVALVNETFVRTQLDGRDPVGVVMREVEGDLDREIRIVGLVEDVVQTRADEGPRAAVYLPYSQYDWPFVQAVVRSELPEEVIVPELRRAVARFSPMVPPRDVRTMIRRMAATRTSPLFQAMLIGSFAVVALLIAAAGLYGTVAHSVGRRRRELGVRIALGAARPGVVALVVRQAMVPTVVGLAGGVVLTVASSRVLSGFLYEIEPTDPRTLTLVAVVLLGVTTVACLLPARRATTVDPVEALRAD
jgi:putative ABC transport system permease protein